ncbi:hypothetical protein GCM10028801_41660 [Nocardioides maradonensis]
MGLRDLYNQFEKTVTPIVNEATRTPQFAQAAAILTAVNKTVRTEADKLQARVWHAMNLPAGTDVQRLKQQVGSLDRELRLLSLELQRARKEAKRHGDSGPQHD